MPLIGTLDVSSQAASAPLVLEPNTEPWELLGAGHLQLMFEIDDSHMVDLLPPALHPTIPPTLLINVLHAPKSSVGQFTLAEVRIGCRSGGRPRAFLAQAYCDSAAAVAELRTRWGYPVTQAEVVLDPQHHQVLARVTLHGKVLLDCALKGPEAINGADIQYLPNMNLARMMRNGAEAVRLLQVDADYAILKADRGRPTATVFVPEAWAVGGATPQWPVSASYATGTVTLPRVRYLANPSLRPLEAVEAV